jgi:hypothetical protein
MLRHYCNALMGIYGFPGFQVHTILEFCMAIMMMT